MSVLLKRKRGRPRLDESRVINNFDSSLIEEVKKFPILFDREHPHYRNKRLGNRYWRLIGNNLNASENVVKNRMLQLRNRFNVEHRRVETLPGVTSNWPLYANLAFLSDYTKRRRPYSLPVSIKDVEPAVTSTDGEDNDEEDEGRFDENNANEMLMNGYITNDNINIMQQPEVTPNFPDIADHHTSLPLINNTVDIDTELYNKKFKAFGEFLASSLIEMNEMQALHLVNKFTTDIVEYSKLEDVNKLMTLNMQNSNGEEEYLLN